MGACMIGGGTRGGGDGGSGDDRGRDNGSGNDGGAGMMGGGMMPRGTWVRCTPPHCILVMRVGCKVRPKKRFRIRPQVAWGVATAKRSPCLPVTHAGNRSKQIRRNVTVHRYWNC